MKTSYRKKQMKYEMEKRKEDWKRMNEAAERLLMVPLEEQASVVEEIVSRSCYNNLCKMLQLPEILGVTEDSTPVSVDTIIPYSPPEEETIVIVRKSVGRRSKSTASSVTSASVTSSILDYEFEHVPETKQSYVEVVTSDKTVTDLSSDQSQTFPSDFVELEKKIPYSADLARKYKAVWRFLLAPEAEAATWRVKESKGGYELSEMTMEEQGDYLINKIAVDFCDWMRELGGDEKSFISEEILKELFEVGMDNPASRAICVKILDKRVLHQKLADYLGAPDKSYHHVLTQHLHWDVAAENMPSKLVAFGEGLPKDLLFKTPENKTAETWLEWNKMQADQLSFADVYSSIKDLRSTKEYCKWLLVHPEHKRPQYLVEQGMFERASSGQLRLTASGGESPRRGPTEIFKLSSNES